MREKGGKRGRERERDTLHSGHFLALWAQSVHKTSCWQGNSFRVTSFSHNMHSMNEDGGGGGAADVTGIGNTGAVV